MDSETRGATKQIKVAEVIKGALSSLKQFLATESSLKMMKNPFYFTLKTLFVLKIFRKQTISVDILPNISRRKGNQTTKFGQLIEYNKM